MTSKTIDGVSRELLERIAKTCMFTMLELDLHEVNALLAAPEAPRQEPAARWKNSTGDLYRLCPVVGNLQIKISAYGDAERWRDVQMSPAQALTTLSPLAPVLPDHSGDTANMVALTAVATLVDDGDGGLEPSWLLEGGTAELVEGMYLLVADTDQTLCVEDGHCELYRAPQEKDNTNIALAIAIARRSLASAEWMIRRYLPTHNWLPHITKDNERFMALLKGETPTDEQPAEVDREVGIKEIMDIPGVGRRMAEKVWDAGYRWSQQAFIKEHQ
jgi:hypothetical protein